MSDLDATPIQLATELTIAWLSNPNTRAEMDDVTQFLTTAYQAVQNVSMTIASSSAPEPALVDHTPPFSVRKSLASKDHILSMIDGKPYKTLRRHLSTHGLTPDEYRARYGLKDDYPMVAESYSEKRRTMALKIGLGRNPGQKAK